LIGIDCSAFAGRKSSECRTIYGTFIPNTLFVNFTNPQNIKSGSKTTCTINSATYSEISFTRFSEISFDALTIDPKTEANSPLFDLAKSALFLRVPKTPSILGYCI